jgi:signal transduction histidine kinase
MVVEPSTEARPDAPADEIEPRPRLVLRFALYAGAVLLAAGCAIAWLVSREVADHAERTVENQATAVVEASLSNRIRPSDLSAPVSPARRAALDELFREARLAPGVVGGRLVNHTGTITYAARHELIGTRESRGELARVLDGAVVRRVARATTWRGERGLKVLRVLVPARAKAGGPPLGAIELDRDYRAVDVGVGDAHARLAAILGLALLALYVSLFPILRRVTRQLEARNRRLRDHAEERGRLLENERIARAEAEAAQRLLTEQNDRLRELDRLKDELVSLVSHELRTPLTSVRGYVELLLDDHALTPDQRRFLGIVDRNSRRLLELVSDLLLLAQLDAGKLALEKRPVDLERLVRECVETASPEAEARGLELVVHAERLPDVLGDRVRLGQVLDNLVSNALKFTPSGGRVEVRLDVTDGAAVVEVADTGLGIPLEEQAHLFDRFFRSSRAEENAVPGTGLGLAITKAIVERHGGRIALRSSEGNGTTVRVELPLRTGSDAPVVARGLGEVTRSGDLLASYGFHTKISSASRRGRR